jgi:eukaryotic-like serine/threonine-protein kinase
VAELKLIGKYEIRRELGRGAMGVVYEAYDTLIKRLVALKTIRADQLTGDTSENIIARFRREAQAAGRLNHPSIVSIYDFGEDAGVSFIAMEYVKGRELKDYFQSSERFTNADVVRIMTQILSALDYAHKQGVVHRDIKPANIFLQEDGTVKVADFGIAHIETSNMTQVGTAIGTPAYMSPEQIQGLPIDGRSDLFSAGVILYQFLTGERPFGGSSTTTMRKVLEEDPLPPSRFNVQVPAAMDAVVRRALAKRADDRFQTAREFADALTAAASGAGAAAAAGAATSAGAAEATVLNAAADPTRVDRAATPAAAPAYAAPGKGSQSSAMAIVGVAVAVAIGVAAWYGYTRMSGSAPVASQASAPAPAGVGPSNARAAAAAATGSPPSAPPAASPPSVAASPAPAAPGAVVITAVGLVDPSDPRYQSDKSLQQSDLRADTKSQLVEKAVGMMVDRGSLAKNYDVVRDKLLSRSGDFVKTVVNESEPRLGKDGLVSMTTQAVVDVRAVQKSLNQMSRDERIELIRAKGDPKVSVRIGASDADQPGAPPVPSVVAENLLKERIKSFGFRTWSEDGARADADPKGADFAIVGEAKLKRLSMQLPTSGLTATKFALTSWTIKCIDRATGEEIYYNTALPKGLGSWATEEEALRAIGGKMADEFSRDFFLQHVVASGQRVTIKVDGLPGGADDPLLRELIGLPGVIAAASRAPRTYDVQLAESGPASDVVAAAIVRPLNAKLGQACLGLGATAGDQVTLTLDAKCADPGVMGRLDTNPPASLYGAPPSRQKAVIKNPDTLKKVLT